MFDFSVISEALTSQTALWWVWALFVLIFLLMSAILTYHWRPYYSIDPHVRTMRRVHHIGGALLLVIAALILIFA